MNVTQVTVHPLRIVSDQPPCLGKWRKMTSDMTTDQQESRRRTQRSGGGSSQSESSLKMQRHDSAALFIHKEYPWSGLEVGIWFSDNTMGVKYKIKHLKHDESVIIVS